MTESYTVPALSLVCMAVSCLLALGVPLALAFLCGQRRRSAWRAVGVGAACFVLFALVIEQFYHQAVHAFLPAVFSHPAAYVTYGALTAGLFEEAARLVGLRILCRREADVLTGFAYGVGHGGIEAVYIGAMGMVNNIVTAAMLNTGGAEALLAGVPAEQLPLARSQLAALAETPALTFLAGGAERLVTMALHIALSVLVWMVVTGRLPARAWAAAMLLHAGADVVAGLYQTGVLTNVWLTEALVAAYTAAVCCGVWQVYRRRAEG